MSPDLAHLVHQDPTTASDRLLSFTGRVDPGNRLEWVTATEINNDYFSLERSRDGLEFSAIARVDGAGNSSQPAVPIPRYRGRRRTLVLPFAPERL